MTRLTWAFGANADALGQQRYEQQVQQALTELPEAAGWEFTSARLAPLRSPLTDVRRVPDRLMQRATSPVARLVGALAYPRGLIHRFDLRLPPAGAREVTTVHGLEPWRFDDEGGRPQWLEAEARRSFGAITPSRFTAGEVTSVLGITRVWAVPHGLGAQWTGPAPLQQDQLAGLGITGPFVLHAAGATKRKNLGALAQAWPRVHSATGAQLVLCGGEHPRRTALFTGLPGVRLVGRQTDEILLGLMSSASVVVVPSLYEGFGLPALEAMSCGTPVVAANCAALPEVCSDFAVLVEPDATGLARGLEEVLSRRDLSARLAQAGLRRASDFTWRVSALAHLGVYQELANARFPGGI